MLQTLSISPVSGATPCQVFTHIITLVDRRTEKETCLTIKTLSDRFCDVMRELQRLKAENRLLGYEVSEIFSPDAPF